MNEFTRELEVAKPDGTVQYFTASFKVDSDELVSFREPTSEAFAAQFGKDEHDFQLKLAQTWWHWVGVVDARQTERMYKGDERE